MLFRSKDKHHNIKFAVATNHVTFVHEYILNIFDSFFDKIYISANMHEIKPDKNFYLSIAKDLNVLPEEILFLDDSTENVKGANECGLHTIHVTKETNILREIANIV